MYRRSVDRFACLKCKGSFRLASIAPESNSTEELVEGNPFVRVAAWKFRSVAAYLVSFHQNPTLHRSAFNGTVSTSFKWTP